MTSVERVKAICKERNLSIAKLERELGYSNGYIGQLRKGVFPTDRLIQIAEYLSVDVNELLGLEAKEEPPATRGGGLYETQYDKLTDENKARIDDLIAQLLKSQSAD